jgi:hypothetical protein
MPSATRGLPVPCLTSRRYGRRFALSGRQLASRGSRGLGGTTRRRAWPPLCRKRRERRRTGTTRSRPPRTRRPPQSLDTIALSMGSTKSLCGARFCVREGVQEYETIRGSSSCHARRWSAAHRKPGSVRQQGNSPSKRRQRRHCPTTGNGCEFLAVCCPVCGWHSYGPVGRHILR